MTKIVATLVLTASVLSTAATANAAPRYGNALQEAAAFGFITPHGVFEGR